MTAFDIGYSSFKNDKSGIPSMNADLQDFMHSSGAWSSNNHELIMNAMSEFSAGWKAAEKEWEDAFFAG